MNRESRMTKNTHVHRWVLLVGILISIVVALHIGAMPIAVWPGLLGQDELARQVLLEIRLPRVLLALLVGAGLGLAGAAMQGLLRNPLAEPGILGVSSGSALAAVVVLYFGIAGWHSLMLPISAMLGSALALFIVVTIAGLRASMTALILAGVAVSAFFSALIALALSLSPSPFALQEINFWLLGSFAYRDLAHVGLVAVTVIPGALILLGRGRFLEGLTLGEESAAAMGFHVPRERLFVLIGTAVVVGGAVAVTGVIGFVGLIIPHLIRPLVRANPRALLLSSMLGAALLVLWMDMLAQVLPTTRELQIGVLSALVGGPFFLLLLLRAKRGYRL